MSSPCRNSWPSILLLLACTLAAGCERERREFHGSAAPPRDTEPVRVGELQPGAQTPAPVDAHGRHFERNAWHINQGEQLYEAFNCSGCHAHGGGAIGPALMDEEWRYGGSIEQIHATIVQGRPNGMPSFRGKIPDDQVWQIAAYVRSLSGNVPSNAASSRREGMAATPSLSQAPKLEPETTESSQ